MKLSQVVVVLSAVVVSAACLVCASSELDEARYLNEICIKIYTHKTVCQLLALEASNPFAGGKSAAKYASLSKKACDKAAELQRKLSAKIGGPNPTDNDGCGFIAQEDGKAKGEQIVKKLVAKHH